MLKQCDCNMPSYEAGDGFVAPKTAVKTSLR